MGIDPARRNKLSDVEYRELQRRFKTLKWRRDHASLILGGGCVTAIIGVPVVLAGLVAGGPVGFIVGLAIWYGISYVAGSLVKAMGATSHAKVGRARSRVIPSAVKLAVWKRDSGNCDLCGSNIDLHYDHDIPHSKGGGNTVENIRLLCARCNLRKGARIE